MLSSIAALASRFGSTAPPGSSRGEYSVVGMTSSEECGMLAVLTSG